MKHWQEFGIVGTFITGTGCIFFSKEIIGVAMLIVSGLGLAFQVFKYWRQGKCKK